MKKPANLKHLKHWEEIQNDSCNSEAYCMLGIGLLPNESIVLPDNSKVTERDLYLLAIKYNSSNSLAYRDLGKLLKSGEKITLLNGICLSKTELESK